MKPVKIAMMGMTHGHTRKYYQTLLENKKLDWVASCAQDEDAKKTYELYQTGVPCYLDPEEMYRKHPDIEAVVIASANDRHFEQMKWCAEKGIHILSMKIPNPSVEAVDAARCDGPLHGGGVRRDAQARLRPQPLRGPVRLVVRHGKRLVRGCRHPSPLSPPAGDRGRGL